MGNVPDVRLAGHITIVMRKHKHRSNLYPIEIKVYFTLQGFKKRRNYMYCSFGKEVCLHNAQSTEIIIRD